MGGRKAGIRRRDKRGRKSENKKKIQGRKKGSG
jgi:hypothetical protein